MRSHGRRTDGLPRLRLEQIGRALTAAPDATYITDSFVYAGDGDYEEEHSQILANKILRLAFDCTAVIIDCGFDYDESARGTFDMLMALGLKLASDKLAAEESNCKVALLLSKLPDKNDLIATLGLSNNWFEGHCIVASMSGDLWENNRPADLTDQILELSRETPHLVREVAESRLVRRRGVFRIKKGRDNDLTEFRFSGVACGAHFARLLKAYVQDRDIGAFIIDDASPAWMKEPLAGVVYRMRIPIWTTEELEDEDFRAKAVDSVKSKSAGRVCLVVPLYKSGHALGALAATANNAGFHVYDCLAVLADVNQHSAGQDTRSGAASSFQANVSGTTKLVHYFIPVVRTRLDPNDWRAVMARAFGEIEDDSDSWTVPSRIAMLSLFNDLRMAKELPLPGNRPAISVFPQLPHLDLMDATWLAECMIRTVEKRLSCDRARILVVTTKDDSGAVALADALESRLDVAVVRLGRDEMLDPTLVSETDQVALADFSADWIIALDESTISGGTLRDINSFVANALGREVDLRLVAVTARVGDYRDVVSMYEWSPIVMESSDV